MTRNRIAKSLLVAVLLGALVAALSPFNSVPNTSAQAKQPAPQSKTKFRRTRVTAADIARLPRGKNYVVQISPGTQSRAGTYSGSTTVNSGVLNSRDEGGKSGLTKAGAGTLTLAGTNNIYEFVSDTPIDFSRVVVQTSPDAAPESLEAWLRKHRPASGMRGWPFRRLLIGSAEGIAEVEGWKIRDAAPGTEYKCESGGEGDDYCGCSSILDCTLMVVAGKCSSSLSCGDGECYCDAR
ncbi:MAG TPA: autotransporter-associated beta strand repeat-containing protein [Pyrinomonadaceae bacterium]|jgi:hypothetical protein